MGEHEDNTTSGLYQAADPDQEATPAAPEQGHGDHDQQMAGLRERLDALEERLR